MKKFIEYGNKREIMNAVKEKYGDVLVLFPDFTPRTQYYCVCYEDAVRFGELFDAHDHVDERGGTLDGEYRIYASCMQPIYDKLEQLGVGYVTLKAFI